MFLVTIGGQSAGVVNVQAGEDDLAVLQSLIEGKIEVYDSKGQGGTALASAPKELNTFRFSVGKKDATNSNVADRCSVKIPHVKLAKSFQDIETAVIGQFDASFEVDFKCEYANLYYNKMEKL